jgi:thiamine transport system substrate-binding protein
MRLFLSIAGIVLANGAGAETPVLTIDVPDSFASEWGPGPAIEEAFETACSCDLQYRAGLQIARLKLEGSTTPADIVMGISTDETAQARATGVFAPHGQDVSDLTLPFAWEDAEFLPFNWGHTAFIYDGTKLDTPPHSFADLLALPDDVKIVIQDPRTSSSGLALLLWVKAVYGEGAEAYWAALAPHILTVTASWAEAYGLFTDGEADLVLSYTTSPAYHMIVEKDDTKKAAIFAEGHYFDAELVGKLRARINPNWRQSL